MCALLAHFATRLVASQSFAFSFPDDVMIVFPDICIVSGLSQSELNPPDAELAMQVLLLKTCAHG